MKHLPTATILISLAIARSVAAENGIGLYFDEAGTQSLLVLDPSAADYFYVSLHVVLKEPTSSLSGFTYQHSASLYRPGVSLIEHTFLPGQNCQGIAHCDPLFWFVTQYLCTCTQASTIVLQTLRFVIFPAAGTQTFDIEPSDCLVWRGFGYLPCGTTDTDLAVPFVKEEDASATIAWGTIAVEAASFGAIKALY